MKTLIVTLIAGLSLATSFAAGTAKPAKKQMKDMSPEEREAFMKARIERLGGMCESQSEGLRFLFADCTKGMEISYNRTFEQIKFACQLVPLFEKMELGGKSPLAFGRSLLESRKDVAAAVVLCEGAADDPIETVYPTERLTVVNVTPLRTDDRLAYNHRMNAMLWRGFAFTAGGTAPFGFKCLMANVRTVKDIDALTAVSVCPPVVQNIVAHREQDFRFSLIRSGTYHEACLEGWAPAPTNDVQRKVWDRVHALPDKPLKIEYDPKKGR